MPGILLRVLIAVVAVLLVFALVPPVFHLLGLTLNADLWTIIRVCTAGLALFYILRGTGPRVN